MCNGGVGERAGWTAVGDAPGGRGGERRGAHTTMRAAPAMLPRSFLTLPSSCFTPFVCSDAVFQDFPHEANAGGEAEAEQADPAVDPVAHGQHDPVST